MWKKIKINKNQIKHETGRSTLINFPKNSTLSGMSFWYPSKLISDGSHSACLSLSYNDNFQIKATKYGKGKRNKFEKIEECEISIEDFESAFGVLIENSEQESYLEVTEPKPLNIEVVVKNELKK